jgi:hypothetical protein
VEDVWELAHQLTAADGDSQVMERLRERAMALAPGPPPHLDPAEPGAGKWASLADPPTLDKALSEGVKWAARKAKKHAEKKLRGGGAAAAADAGATSGDAAPRRAGWRRGGGRRERDTQEPSAAVGAAAAGGGAGDVEAPPDTGAPVDAAAGVATFALFDIEAPAPAAAADAAAADTPLAPRRRGWLRRDGAPKEPKPPRAQRPRRGRRARAEEASEESAAQEGTTAGEEMTEADDSDAGAADPPLPFPPPRPSMAPSVAASVAASDALGTAEEMEAAWHEAAAAGDAPPPAPPAAPGGVTGVANSFFGVVAAAARFMPRRGPSLHTLREDASVYEDVETGIGSPGELQMGPLSEGGGRSVSGDSGVTRYTELDEVPFMAAPKWWSTVRLSGWGMGAARRAGGCCGGTLRGLH